MFAILLTAASLLAQAYLFRDLDKWEVNSDVTLAVQDPDPSRADTSANVWAAESDSSQIAGTAEAR